MRHKPKLYLLIMGIVLLLLGSFYIFYNNLNNKNIKTDNVTNSENVQLFVEKDDGWGIAGGMGEQVRLVSLSTIPATITYTIKYKTGDGYPGGREEYENVTSNTISVDPGKTIIGVFLAIDGKVDIKFTYVDNTNKPYSEINPKPKKDTKLYKVGIIGDNDLNEFKIYAESNVEAVAVYTITYTKPNSKFMPSFIHWKEKTITKTVNISPGLSEIDTIISVTPLVLNYTIK